MGAKIRALALVLGLLLSGLPMAVPALQGFLDPVHGVMGAPMSGGVPGAVVEAPGIPGRAEVVFDRFAVPHIYATTDEAGAYAVGWVTASMRLFQMDVLRRVAEGRLSELLGPKALDSDRFMIQSGIADSVDKSWEAMRSNPGLEPVVRLLEAYSRGVNDYIRYAIANNALPVEYRILGQAPENWTPRDTISVAKLIAYMLAWNDEDLVMQHIVNTHGPEAVRLAEIFDFLDWRDTLAQADCRLAVSWANVTGINETLTLAPATSGPERVPVSGVLRLAEAPTMFIGGHAGLEASNNWVVNGSYSSSGKPIVANDPHLALTAPPIWILMEIQTPSFHSIGALFPGTPLIVIGRNEHVAWGFTNLMGDFTDYYYYAWRDGKYLYKGQWLEPEREERVVRVWDPVRRAYHEERIPVERTVHGYLIETGDGERLAVRWTGQDASYEIAFFYYLNRAGSVLEALRAQRYFHVPIQNFVVADDQGSFAYSPFGAYPVRTNLPVYNISGERIVNKGFLPFNGSRGEGEWAGYYKPAQIPILYNPPLPFVATANSKPWNGSCGEMAGWHYHDKYRLERIQQLLGLAISLRGRASIWDSASAQLDQYDLGVLDYVGTLLNITRGDNGPLLGLVRSWYANYTRGTPLSPYERGGQTLAIAWLYRFHESLWQKIYGGGEHIWFFRAYYALHYIKAYQEGDPLAREILGNETLHDIALRSLREAAEELAQYYGTSNPQAWVYGLLHYYKPEHLAFPPMNLPEWPAGGATWTVNVAPIKSFTPTEGMPVTVGPSIRMQVDLSTRKFLIMLPGGESGSPYSRHYQDIYLCCWLRGTYIEYTLGQPPETYGPPAITINGQG